MLKIKGKIDNKSGNGKYKGKITLMFKSGELEVVKNWIANQISSQWIRCKNPKNYGKKLSRPLGI
jgi:hypothetical protein